MSSKATMVGLALTLTVHGGMVLFALLYTPADEGLKAARPGDQGSVGSGLCGVQRCRQPETRMRRVMPEEDPVSEMEVLEAALIPALGYAQADPSKLPKLQTYEQPEIVEEGVNLNQNPEKLKELVKEFDKKKATWVSWGSAWEKIYAAFAERAEQYKEAEVTTGGVARLNEPESRPPLATLMVAYFSLYVHHGGELPFSVYCKYGVEVASRRGI